MGLLSCDREEIEEEVGRDVDAVVTSERELLELLQLLGIRARELGPELGEE